MISTEESQSNKVKVTVLLRDATKNWTPEELIAIQNKQIQQIIRNHAQEETVTFIEPEISILRWILQTTSTQLEFSEETCPTYNTSNPVIELKSITETLSDLYDNPNRDIKTVPEELKRSGFKITKTSCVLSAISIIMADLYQRPFDSGGPEVAQCSNILKMMSKELVKEIPLNLLERGLASNFKEAKETSWTYIPPSIRNSFCLLLENQVFKTYGLPISRCEGMWLANHFILQQVRSYNRLALKNKE